MHISVITTSFRESISRAKRVKYYACTVEFVRISILNLILLQPLLIISVLIGTLLSSRKYYKNGAPLPQWRRCTPKRHHVLSVFCRWLL